MNLQYYSFKYYKEQNFKCWGIDRKPRKSLKMLIISKLWSAEINYPKFYWKKNKAVFKSKSKFIVNNHKFSSDFPSKFTEKLKLIGK